MDPASLHLPVTSHPTLATEPISRRPTALVPRPLLQMRWESLAYLHYSLPVETVAAALPAGLEPDTFAGRAWVGLVPFQMAGISLAGAVPLPFGSFPETNVRTYVIGPDGGRGVYFHSLDVPRLAPTLVARGGYRLPYCWSSMRIARRGSQIGYLAVRRWPRAPSARSRIIVDVGDRLTPDRITPLDDFLTARWSLYTASPSGRLLRTLVDHDPWPLYEARVVALEDDLMQAAGYPRPLGSPEHVRVAGPVAVRVGVPRSAVRPPPS